MERIVLGFDSWLNESKDMNQSKYTAFLGSAINHEAENRLVIAIDSSDSLTRQSLESFVDLTLGSVDMNSIEETIIIYASDDIDKVERYSKGETPKIGPVSSTGGNQGGFSPPFKWLEENSITPSAMVYFTDGYAVYPDPSLYGISEYGDKVFWYLYGGSEKDLPTFGEYEIVPYIR